MGLFDIFNKNKGKKNFITTKNTKKLKNKVK